MSKCLQFFSAWTVEPSEVLQNLGSDQKMKFSGQCITRISNKNWWGRETHTLEGNFNKPNFLYQGRAGSSYNQNLKKLHKDLLEEASANYVRATKHSIILPKP